MHRRYGWIPDVPDQRDRMYSAPAAWRKLPEHVDLSPRCPAVWDQGSLGSCTAQAIAAAHEFEQMRDGGAAFTPSRLFIYYNERAAEDTIEMDAGAMIRTGVKTCAKLGACPEADWPYLIERFAAMPDAACYDHALKHQVQRYYRLPRWLNMMRGCLAGGLPFVFGFSVYESFEDEEVARTGIVQMPMSSERMLGGHAVLAVGYDDAVRRFLVRNSWGMEWGMGGYFSMPYEYLTEPDLSDDFWCLTLVEEDE